MGSKKRRLEKFKAEHPICCFCGGHRATETEDHVPSRSIFLSRIWPKGYVFPACVSCNQATAGDEAIIAMLSRFDPTYDEEVDGNREESDKLIQAFSEKHPALVKAMLPTANEVRRSLKKLGISKPDSVGYGEIPIVKVPPELHAAVLRFGSKLVKALHYKHTGRIVPSDAGIRVYWHTNAQHMAGKFPNELLEIFRELALPARDSTPLHDQFSYSYSVSTDSALGGYVVAFRRAFSIIGLLNFDASWFSRHEALLREKAQQARLHQTTTQIAKI